MFDNPEKLFILLVIALLIFGPSKLASIGGTLGRTIRDFRSVMRGAHETFTSEMEQAAAPVEPPAPSLPAPDPMASVPPAYAEPPHTPSSWEPAGMPACLPPPGGSPQGTPSAGPHAAEAEFDGASSLASEPTAEALRRDLQGRG